MQILCCFFVIFFGIFGAFSFVSVCFHAILNYIVKLKKEWEHGRKQR